MAIDHLLRILPKPGAPNEARPAWDEAARELGVALPSDYVSFIETYGTGRIAGFLWIFNPAARRDTVNLVVQASAQAEVLRELAETGEEIPYPLFPEPGGLLTVGMSDNGDVLHWLTEGAAAEWRIVVQSARGAEFVKYDCGVTDFLAGVLTRQIRCPIFHSDFPPKNSSFETF